MQINVLGEDFTSVCEIEFENYDRVILITPATMGGKFAIYSCHSNKMSKELDWPLVKLLGVIQAEVDMCKYLHLKLLLVIRNNENQTTEAITAFASVMNIDTYLV